MDDLISRQAAIEAIEQMQMPIMRSEFPEEQFVFTGMSEALQAIKDLPSAQPTEASCWGCNCPKMERLKEQKTFSEMVHLHDAETHDKHRIRGNGNESGI